MIDLALRGHTSPVNTIPFVSILAFHVHESGRASVAAGQTLANLAVNGKIAVITADPVSYRSIQFKGKWLSSSQPTDDEREWVKRHRELFTTAMALVGDDPEAIRNRWLDEVTRVDFEVEAAFDQTPGPNAGQPL